MNSNNYLTSYMYIFSNVASTTNHRADQIFVFFKLLATTVLSFKLYCTVKHLFLHCYIRVHELQNDYILWDTSYQRCFGIIAKP